MRPRTWAATALLAAATSAAAGIGWARGADHRFPHLPHARVLPTCTGCHAGIESEDSTRFYPPPETCANCHSGAPGERSRVAYETPEPWPSNLRFSHRAHERAAAGRGATVACMGCHALRSPSEWMAVGEARPETCIGCHAHRAPAHLADETPCRTCHVPLTQARALPGAWVARFPLPPSHERQDFVQRHAPSDSLALANCSTCHSRESCSRCHLNAATLQPVARLGGDARVARLRRGEGGEWPEPPSHRDPHWLYEHGAPTRADVQSCANCHALESCRTCHTGTGAAAEIRALPRLRRGGPTGVLFRTPRADTGRVGAEGTGPTHPQAAPRARIARVHAPGFERTHGAAASTDQLNCSGCHARRFCSDCHDGEGRRRFHPPNFIQRHPVQSYGRERDCASCHNPEAFCRDCHASSGLTSQGRLDVAFHNAQPLWLIQHARAARQGLQSCTTCHTQQDCMQCHSTLGWGVNPHGSNFDAERMAKRNPTICVHCHLGDPLRRGR